MEQFICKSEIHILMQFCSDCWLNLIVAAVKQHYPVPSCHKLLCCVLPFMFCSFPSSSAEIQLAKAAQFLAMSR